jgi:hypothetical protein
VSIRNEALRAYTTSRAFVLDLRKTHIETLVYIDWVLELEAAGKHRIDPSFWVRSPSLFATGAPGLERRGLVEHLWQPAKGEGPTNERPFSDFWRITEAGRLVVGLLKEAGLYDEYAACWPKPV